MNDNKRMILNTGILYVKLILTTIIGLVNFLQRFFNQIASIDCRLYSICDTSGFGCMPNSYRRNLGIVLCE